MRIYPDPELPDIEVTWYEGDCDGQSEIALTVTGRDDDTHLEAVASCPDGRYRFVDVPRVRFDIEGAVLAADGSVTSVTTVEADLRDGISKEVYLFFLRSGGVRLSWVFDMGASCQSLLADIVTLVFQPGPFTVLAPCDIDAFFAYPSASASSVVVHARRGLTTVAVSEEVPFTQMPPAVTDLGTLTLTPCGDACPQQ